MGAQIRVPSAADDRPRSSVLWAAALVGAALGTAAVALSARVDHTAAHDTHAHLRDEAAPGEPATEDPRPAKPWPNSVATIDEQDAEGAAAKGEAVSPPDAHDDPSAEKQGTETPATIDAGHTPGPRVTQVLAGRVAYVRCDGLSVQSGPYPCPRDRLLEAAVWDALDLLRQCADARPNGDEPGNELRLDFRGGRVAEARFRVSSAEQQDEEAALERCLREPLGRIETRLRSGYMVVSFRFRLL